MVRIKYLDLTSLGLKNMDSALQHPTTIRPKLPLSSMENSLKFISSIFQTAILHLNSPVIILHILLD